MAHVSPSNLLSLHNKSYLQTSGLRYTPSERYSYGSGAKVVPDPSLFNDLKNQSPNALPTISECAVHLEMLEVFHTLRQNVIHSPELDVAFNIQQKPRTVYRKKWDGAKYVAEPKTLKDTGFGDRRKTKWTHFLSIAAVRFHDWIELVEKYSKERKLGTPQLRYLLLPPLDVLMIWHAFLLNCDDFKEYCERKELRLVQKIAFPWADIHNAINSDTWTYTLPPEHADWLRDTAKIDANLVDALSAAGQRQGAAKQILAAFRKEIFKKNEDPDPLTRTIHTARENKSHNHPLVQNVERQCIFVDKMHAHRLIRSPAVEGTMRRAIDRYDKFLHLFRFYPNIFLVPTLDVDLVWHTHQCSAEHYRHFVTERVGRFINHDDKIGRKTLNDGFTSAEEWYRLRYGERYQVCLCWSCEAILSAVEKLDEDILDGNEPPVSDLAHQVEREVHYYRELEVARRLDRKLPVWSHK
ncbi:uncharacterized protein BJX67DRAFT_363789 [Aspergillus lucknowensis]|uniref:Uncharacterized protein n=1 Tax=Aspergillus lucknowensis TaxID=176173 RepID=A0ABR4LFR2_9EURO